MVTIPVEVYTDGACSGNPGVAGLGYIIQYYETPDDNPEAMPEQKRIEGNEGYRLSTNNRMEILAGIVALTKVCEEYDSGLFKSVSQINLSSDSEYFCKAVNQRWIDRWQQNNWMSSGFQGAKPHPIKNKDLWEKFINIQGELKKRSLTLTMTHVDGHTGIELNEAADRLAVAASHDSANYKIDEEYEKTAPFLNRQSGYNNRQYGNYNNGGGYNG